MTTSSSVRHLYAHVPFCPTKCSYCAFVTHVGSLKLLEPYVSALRAETERLDARSDGGPLESVYFGGGTPSLLEPRHVQTLLQSFDRLLGLASGCEVTLEAHPATVDLSRLQAFRKAGVTRLSFGAESLQEAELRELGREQDPTRPLEVISMAREAGFAAVAVDLMYGIPLQTTASWASSLETLIEACPDHISLYPLSVEPRTIFSLRRRRGRLELPPDGQVAEMYGIACRLLTAAGYEHYEVANWARPGHRCRHNLAYWRNREFFGIGVGAHAYLKPFRTENVRHTSRYIETVARGASPVCAREHVDQRVEIAETMMLGLRLLQDGLDLDEVGAQLRVDLDAAFGAEIRELCGSGLLNLAGRRLTLPETAVPVANEVWARFV